VGDLEDFYHRHYTPDHLTIAVVGDVKAADVISLVDQYFGSWKVPPSYQEPIPDEPPQSGPRRVTVKFEAQPHVIMGFHIAAYPDPDYAVCFAVAQLLGSGTTSRLYKALVEKRKSPPPSRQARITRESVIVLCCLFRGNRDSRIRQTILKRRSGWNWKN